MENVQSSKANSCDDYQNDLKTIRFNITSGDRRFATFLLEKIIPNIDNDLFLEYVQYFMQNILKILEQNDNDAQIFCIRALNQILIRLYKINISNLNRDLSITIVPNLIKRLMQFQSREVYQAAKCLSILATIFPNLVAVNRQTIEKRIFQIVDLIQQPDNDLLKMLGFCYCKVYLTNSTGLMTRWREIISKLLNSLTTFIKHPAFSHITKPKRIFQFTDSEPINIYLLNNDHEITISITNKLYFLTSTLSTCITGQFQIKLPLPIEGIIECLNTMVIVSIAKQKESTITTSSVILDNVFIILRSLIISCKSNILIYTPSLIYIVNKTVEWTIQQQQRSQWNCQLLILRCSILKFLCSYFEILRLNNCFRSEDFDTILNFILETISINESSISSSINQLKIIHNQTTIESIDCLNSLINNSCNILDRNGWHKIQNIIIETLLKLYRQCFHFMQPYNDDNCRQKLIKTLNLLLINLDNTNNDIPLEVIMAILNEANRLENSEQIRQQIMSIIHLTNYVLSSRITINNNQNQYNNNNNNNNNHQKPVSKLIEFSDNDDNNDDDENIINDENNQNKKRKANDDESIECSTSKHLKIEKESDYKFEQIETSIIDSSDDNDDEPTIVENNDKTDKTSAITETVDDILKYLVD